MRVSVILPTFNRAAVLPRAIESIRTQPGVFFEIIVVDDGSTDGTKSVVDKFVGQKAEVRYFFQPNRGPAAARNLGIQNGAGEFIAFLDSDDEWLPGKLKAQLEYFESNSEALVCQTEEIWIRNGRRVNPMKKHQKSGGSIFERCLPLCVVSPSAVMMRREFFDKVGLFDESLPACEDYDLWLRASARFPIGLIETPYVVKYGGHPDQRSREFPVMDQFRIRALAKILESGTLDEGQREAAFAELRRKCEIVSRGASKRGKPDVAEYYRRLACSVIASPAGEKQSTK
jgi:glycosyltransferase involved in cell wall biosynthesis